MTTETLVKPANAKEEQPLIQPNNAREALLMKLKEFNTNNLSAREQENYEQLSTYLTKLFYKLCWYKIGASRKQIEQLKQQELNELAAIIHERTSTVALLHTVILMCIPLLGWGIFLMSVFWRGRYDDLSLWQNIRFYWWYKEMKNKYGQVFEPKL